jgi:hypothetical protein
MSSITIRCPACGENYETWRRGSSNAVFHPALATDPEYLREWRSVACPGCTHVVELGLLVLDDDDVWRVSPFAGHASDVSVAGPPGGQISYRRRESEAPGAATAQTAEEAKTRQRALSVIDGRAPDVGAGAQREAVELALRVGVLDETEAARGQAWVKKHARQG